MATKGKKTAAAKTKGKAKKATVKKGAETKKAKAKPAKTKAKGEKELTPIQKAQAARAAGKGKKGKAKAKKAKITFKAPADLKPIFVKVDGSFGKDGHLSNSRVTAIKGKLGGDTAKTVALSLYDERTANAVVARVAGPMFIRSEKKRLPAGAQFSAVFRVGKKKDGGTVSVRLKEARWKLGDKKPKMLDKKDPVYRTIRKSARPLEGAFTKLLPFPSNKELKALTSDKE